MNIIQDDICNQSYDSVDTSTQFCAGHSKGGRDSCTGDSGGPLICINEQNEPILYGAVSWGGVCAAPYQPGVYTRINRNLV